MNMGTRVVMLGRVVPSPSRTTNCVEKERGPAGVEEGEGVWLGVDVEVGVCVGVWMVGVTWEGEGGGAGRGS